MLPLNTHRVNPRLALRQEFDKQAWDPETWSGIIAVIAAILVLLLFLHFLLYYEKRAARPRALRDRNKLFSEIVRNLSLGHSQRLLLRRMVRELRPEHPAQVLLSPKLFEAAISEWLGEQASTRDRYCSDLRHIAEVLFNDVDSGASARLERAPAT